MVWTRAVVLVAILAAATLVPAPAQAGGTGIAVGDVSSHFTWTTTMRGDLVFKITMDTQGTGTCDLRVDASGAIGSDPIFTYLGHDTPGRGWTVLGQPDTHAHVGGFSIRSQVLGNLWAASHTHRFSAGLEETYVFAANNLDPWNDPFAGTKSLSLDLSCFGTLEVVAIDAGTGVSLQDPQSLRGGAGASAEPFGVSAQALDGFSAQLGRPDGMFRWRSDDPFAAGSAFLSHPGGSSSRLLLGGDEWFVDAPGGSWRLDLDARASIGNDEAVILFASTEPVASLDAAVVL